MKKGITVIAIALATSAAAFAAQSVSSADQLSALKLIGSDNITIVLDQRFNPSLDRYTAVVQDNVDAVTVNAAAADPSAKVEGNGLVPLSFGNNDIPVTVTGADGVAVTYKVRVTRNRADMSDAWF